MSIRKALSAAVVSAVFLFRLSGAEASGETAFTLGDVSAVVYSKTFTETVVRDGRKSQPHIWGYSAARDLAQALSRVTGRKIGSVPEGRPVPAQGVRVYVGDTDAARAAGLDASALMRGEFRIVTGPGAAYILSNTGMAATYGVAEFLQRYADYWFCLASGDDPYVLDPARRVPKADFRAKHAFYVRTYNMWGRRYAKTCATVGGDYTRRMRCRSWWPEIEPSVAFSSRPGPYNPCHTYFAYCPPSVYAKDHPEYFAMGPDGNRRFRANASSQLCLTHPEVFEIVWSNLCSFIEKDRAELGAEAPVVYDFSQMDNSDFICLCPSCRKVIAKYDRKGGHKDGGDAGLQLEFVNRLARRAAAKYPGVIIRTFAYVSTDTPPAGGIRPEPNVMIWYCDLYSKCDHMRPLRDPFNVRSCERLRGWRALTDNLEVWDYYLSDGTWVAIDAIASDIRWFRDMGIDRIGPETTFNRQPFYELNMFVTSQLYFDPDQDVEMLLGKWCRVYGRGAAKMKEAIDYLRAVIRDNPAKDYAGWHNGVWPWRAPRYLEKFLALVKDAYAEEAEGSVYRARMAAPLADVSKFLMRRYKSMPGRAADYERTRDDYRKYALEDLAQTYVAPVDAARDRADVEKTLALMDLEFRDLPAELAGVPRDRLHFVDWRNMSVDRGKVKTVTDDVPQPGGKAFVWTPEKKKDPPFNCSMLDEDLQTNHLHPFTPPADGKWRWIRIAVDRLGRGGWVGLPYIGDNSISFRIQHLYVECDGLDADPNRYEMWISCRYGGDTGDPEKSLAVDRLILRRIDP